jgi:hypothetical protein
MFWVIDRRFVKISNWEVMEKVKEMARPFTFPVFKVRLHFPFTSQRFEFLFVRKN